MADDKELDAIIDKMIANGESEENIGAVIQAYGEQRNAPKPGSGLNKPIKSASTFGQGVLDSITSGEASSASLQGLAGWGKGAFLNLIPDAAKGLYQVGRMANFSNPMDQAQAAYEGGQGLMGMPGHMWETTKNAGAKPFEFGEMAGQLTGQPAVGELAAAGILANAGSITRNAGAATRTVGRGASKTGRALAENAPISGTVPKFMLPRTADLAERTIGRGVAKIGDSMQRAGMPKIMQAGDYGPVPFTPKTTPISPTADLRGSSAFPETSTTPRELIQNDQYGPTDEFVNSVLAPGGEMRGSMASPEMSMRPPELIENANYGPVDFTPDQPLVNPTGRNRGGMTYPELNDTPPSLITNSQAASDQFAQSVLAPTGEGRGSMAFPETSMRPADLMQNHEYGPVDFTPPPVPEPQAIPYAGPIEGKLANKPWGSSDNVSFGEQPNLWTEPSGADTAIINRSPEIPPAPSNFAKQVTGDDVFDLGEISGTDTSASAMDVGLDQADTINPRGPNYTQDVLKQVKPGKGGFAQEGNKLIYRGIDGQPVGVATIKGDTIIDFAIDKSKGLLTGRAAKKLGDELEKLGISKIEGGMTPDALNFMNRRKNTGKKSGMESFPVF